MTDPLAEIVDLLQPSIHVTKVVSAAGRWGVRRTEYEQPFYAVLLEGQARLAVDGDEPLWLEAGDFVLIPSAPDFTLSGRDVPQPDELERAPQVQADGTYRLGTPDGPPDLRSLVGHCAFGSPDAALLVPLLPRVVHIRGDARLSSLVQLVSDEARAHRPAREVILGKLLEVLLIEALRGTGATASPGLLRGLQDARVACALRAMHAQPAQAWTVAHLAREASLSRSAFFERFTRALGLAPMEYLLTWRMAIAKTLLRTNVTIAEVAQRVGYASASAFTVAFSRHVGLPPTRYLRDLASDG